ncbi:mitochondrial ribosomal subunit protein-domain-containing protein [Desarmillaria tabescens]|uniref:Mitochondrial ribosomal subunit protein-domain-containing protein n=1 Tax=Armillaria tabescens TaxID=1929756 RepID=A0AA39TSD0_ARMTA|nr:mitochondrial ribosomal subunit protein-domain-containing protein [Desarmillaria tabescens]KAK0464908.1 mitochondrial ribosomal subunit protein-domain-containing protein [Desarmillaria tabescens]
MAFRVARFLTRPVHRYQPRPPLSPSLCRNLATPPPASEGADGPKGEKLAAKRKEEDDELITEDLLEDILEDPYDGDDTVSAGHMMLQQQRETLHYLRLIEHEMPKLVAYRKPFIPPTSATPLVVRSLGYGGEPHPATNKRVVVVAVDDLPLKDEAAIHRIKVLAGPRWAPRPPLDGGISNLDNWGNGYIKISCENFPRPEMNLSWASDTLDRLIQEANERINSTMYPLDLRHIFARARKAKKGEHLRGRIYSRPTIHDFPKEWLPPTATSDSN